jgi:hypothetical protein
MHRNGRSSWSRRYTSVREGWPATLRGRGLALDRRTSAGAGGGPPVRGPGRRSGRRQHGHRHGHRGRGAQRWGAPTPGRARCTGARCGRARGAAGAPRAYHRAPAGGARRTRAPRPTRPVACLFPASSACCAQLSSMAAALDVGTAGWGSGRGTRMAMPPMVCRYRRYAESIPLSRRRLSIAAPHTRGAPPPARCGDRRAGARVPGGHLMRWTKRYVRRSVARRRVRGRAPWCPIVGPGRFCQTESSTGNSRPRPLIAFLADHSVTR